MVGNGYLIALARDHAKRLFAQQSDDQLWQFLEELRNSRELKASGRALELGTLWDPLHRCLTEGELDPTGGEPPLNQTLLGGRPLQKGSDFVAAVVRPDMTTFIAEALQDVKEDGFRTRFFGLDPKSYGRPIDEKHFMEVWVALRKVQVFYEAAADNLEAVVFAGSHRSA